MIPSAYSFAGTVTSTCSLPTTEGMLLRPISSMDDATRPGYVLNCSKLWYASKRCWWVTVTPLAPEETAIVCRRRSMSLVDISRSTSDTRLRLSQARGPSSLVNQTLSSRSKWFESDGGIRRRSLHLLNISMYATPLRNGALDRPQPDACYMPAREIFRLDRT